jgi:hypothetical protein
LSLTYRFHRGEARPTPAYPFDTIFRPEIAVWIGVGDRPRKPYLGLLDTGADDTKLPISQAERLGVDLDRENPVLFRGVGGETVGYFGKVTMELRQSPKSYVWTATVSFLLDPPGSMQQDRISISLGHTGFFRYFHAAFDFQRGRVKLRPNRLFVGQRR